MLLVGAGWLVRHACMRTGLAQWVGAGWRRLALAGWYWLAPGWGWLAGAGWLEGAGWPRAGAGWLGLAGWGWLAVAARLEPADGLYGQVRVAYCAVVANTKHESQKQYQPLTLRRLCSVSYVRL